MRKSLIRIIPAPDGEPATIIHGKRQYQQHLSQETRAIMQGMSTAWFWAELVDGVWWIEDKASRNDLDDLRRSIMRGAKTIASSRFSAGGGERRKAAPRPVTLRTFSWDESQ